MSIPKHPFAISGKAAKPRNPTVVPLMHCKPGRHEVANKAQRRQEKQRFQLRDVCAFDNR